jgi:uncharacterized protein YecT (DUF1311 family)
MFRLIASFTLYLALALQANANECDNATTQAASNACAKLDFVAADAQLNEAYAEFKKLVAADAKAKSHLVKAQRAWITFRDAECALEGTATEGGSAQPMIILQCKTRLTLARVSDFRVRLSCTECDLSCFNGSDAAD